MSVTGRPLYLSAKRGTSRARGGHAGGSTSSWLLCERDTVNNDLTSESVPSSAGIVARTCSEEHCSSMLVANSYGFTNKYIV